MLKKIEVRVQYSQDCIDPRDTENLWRLLMFSKHYNLGDKELADHTPVPHYSYFRDCDDIEAWVKSHVKDAIIRPLYMMVHGDILFDADTWRFHQVDPNRWDWGQVGFAVTSPATIKEFLRVPRLTKKRRLQSYQILKQELTAYEKYVNGEVYDAILTFHTEEGTEHTCVGDFFGWEEIEQFVESLRKEHEGVPVELIAEE